MNNFESTIRFKLEAIIQFYFTKHQVRKFYISKFKLKLLSSPLLDISHTVYWIDQNPTQISPITRMRNPQIQQNIRRFGHNSKSIDQP